MCVYACVCVCVHTYINNRQGTNIQHKIQMILEGLVAQLWTSGSPNRCVSLCPR